MRYAKKELGQHFLTNASVLSETIAAADIHADDHLVEIGPGRGALTRLLAATPAATTALEFDGDLIPALRHEFSKNPRVSIVHLDVRSFVPPSTPYKLVANIPYYLTSPILRQFFLETENPPSLAVLLVQKEVAEKVASTKKSSILQLQVLPTAEAKLLRTVPKAYFDPPPKVESALLLLTRRDQPLLPQSQRLAFAAFTHHLFRFPRKKIKAAYPAEKLIAAGIDTNLRAEDLSLTQCIQLFHQK